MCKSVLILKKMSQVETEVFHIVIYTKNIINCVNTENNKFESKMNFQ